MSPKDFPWARRPETRGVPASIRQHDVINIAFKARLAKCRLNNPATTIQDASAEFFVDVMPSIHFKAWGSGLKGLTTGSLFYSYELKRTLSVLEHYDLLGYDRSNLSISTLTRSEVADLTGNANSLLQAALVMYSIVLTVDIAGLWEFP